VLESDRNAVPVLFYRTGNGVESLEIKYMKLVDSSMYVHVYYVQCKLHCVSDCSDMCVCVYDIMDDMYAM